MPEIILKVWIEKELENGSLKHYLNQTDFDVISSKEDDHQFAMKCKKTGWVVGSDAKIYDNRIN